MQKNIFLIFFFAFILYSNQDCCLLAAQDDSIYFPIYDVFASADFINGLRLGGRIQITEHFSFEAGYGQDLVNFIGPSDINYRYSIGINWHKSTDSKLVINVSYARAIIKTDLTTIINNYSLSIGSLSLLYSNIHIFYSGGLWIKNKINENVNFMIASPNIEIGIGWRIN